MKVGYIGLGALGSELAKCFTKSHELHVWDIDAAACDRLGALGVGVAPTAAELGAACDAVLLCLPRSANVREVLFGPSGLAEGLSPGTLVIDQTSGVPEETREMAQRLQARGVDMMDAAVSASPHVVSTGGATLMASGPDAVYARALPLLQAITSTIFRCGDRVGDGQAMKIVNNAMNAGVRMATLENVALGRRAGLPLAAMTEVLNKGAGRNQTTEKMLPAIARGEASTNFALALMLKDVSQAVQLGSAAGVPMPLTRIVRSLLQIGLNTVGPAARLEDMIGVIEGMAGTKIGGSDRHSGMEVYELLNLVDDSTWAVCRAISCECMAVGTTYGLPPQSMAAVLDGASGWSFALRELTAVMRGANPSSSSRKVGAVAATLGRAIDAGIRYHAPLLIGSVAGSLFDQALNDLGADAGVDLMARQQGLLRAEAAGDR